ncbi:MAG TPA: hypothetical protein GXX75_21130 [Clostridiales bacterium]|nr:hypothetical protein [Clostridiales bacterium]
MVTIDGKWVMEGLADDDPKRIKTSGELSGYINKVGFLPLFKNSVQGFSVEEITGINSWWSDKPEEDPWAWREVIAAEGRIAYGKLFGNRAGFVSREWYPYLAAFRRDGYDFDSRYEDGLASYRAKRIMEVLELRDEMPSNELKTAAGFGKGGEKGFEGTMALLQMQTYITVKGFHRKRNKKNEEYGWPVANYTLSENLFGRDYVRSAYDLNTLQAKDKIVDWIISKFSMASRSEIEKTIK